MSTTSALPHRVLHLLGAHNSDFYRDLSLVYGRSCHRPSSMEHVFGLVEPGRGWRLGADIDELGEPQPTGRFLDELGHVDLVVPYMFDPLGMTSYRSFFEDIIGVPVVGSRADVTSVAQDKTLTKHVLAAAGIAVPADIDPQNPSLPAIVKPAAEDNSRGLSLVHDVDALEAALDEARRFGDDVVVEQFVPGREVRVAVIELDGTLKVPAMLEYTVSSDQPLRQLEHKLDLDAAGNPVAQSTASSVRSVCPAPLEAALQERLAEIARAAHRALRCRDYSLFDVRIDDVSDEPYVLEAGLFWTFGPRSIITQMLEADVHDPSEVISSVWRAAAARGLSTRSSEAALTAS